MSEVTQLCSLQPDGLYPSRFLHPWDFPGKNTGVGCYFLLQGIFLTQGLNPGLPHCRQTLYPLSHQGSLTTVYKIRKSIRTWAPQVALVVKNLPTNAGDTRGFDPWVGKILCSREQQPIPVFLPGNSMCRGAWQATVHGATKNWTWLSAWRIPGTGEPDGLLSLGLHRVRHDWSDLATAAAASDWVQGPTVIAQGTLLITL